MKEFAIISVKDLKDQILELKKAELEKKQSIQFRFRNPSSSFFSTIGLFTSANWVKQLETLSQKRLRHFATSFIIPIFLGRILFGRRKFFWKIFWALMTKIAVSQVENYLRKPNIKPKLISKL